MTGEGHRCVQHSPQFPKGPFVPSMPKFHQLLYVTFTLYCEPFERRVRNIAKSCEYLRHVCPSLCPHENNWAASGRVFMELKFYVFFETMSRKSKFH